MLEPIVKAKKINAGDTNLITIGKNLKNELMKINELEHIDIVFIENVSPIANRIWNTRNVSSIFYYDKASSI